MFLWFPQTKTIVFRVKVIRLERRVLKDFEFIFGFLVMGNGVGFNFVNIVKLTEETEGVTNSRGIV